MLAASAVGASPIRPSLSWLGYLGGAGTDDVRRIAYDSQGNVWLAGATSDPTTWERGAARVVQLGPGGGGDAVVARLDAQGELALLVFLGGSGGDSALSLACGADGSVIVGGSTSSVDFPTTIGAIQRDLRGQTDGFVAKLASNGDLVWSTLLGGSSWDSVLAATIAADGSVVVGGSTWSPDFPEVSPLQGAGPPGQEDGFVTVLSAGGDRIQFSTHLGGSAFDEVRDVAVDNLGNVVAVGQTASTDFPLRQPYQRSLADASLCGGDAFVTKISWPGAALLFSTYLGGTQEDGAEGVAVDGNGKPTVVGTTLSPDFPWTPGAYLGSLGAFNLFVTRMTSDGSGLVFSGRLPLTSSAGGPGCAAAPRWFRVALDGEGRSWAVGVTSVSNFPLVSPLQRELLGPTSGFISVLSNDGKQLEFSSYLGGSGSDALRDVAVSPGGEVFIAGYTESPDLPASQGSYHGAGDVFVARISTTASALAATATASSTSGLAPLAVAFSASASGGTGLYGFEWDFGDTSPHSSQQNPSHTYALGGDYTATLTVTDSASATATASVVVHVTHNCSLACTAGAPLVVAVGQAASFSASSTASDCVGSPSYLWAFGDGQTSTEQAPSHAYASAGVFAWSVQASIGPVTCSRSGTIAVASAPVNASYVIPALAHKPGYFGSQWRSDVAVAYPLLSPAPANLTLVFRCAGCAPLFAAASVPAGATVEWRDILTSLFGQADTAALSGSLAVYSDHPVAITARTYNQTAAGTLGQSYPALTSTDGLTSGQTGVLAGIKRNAAFRTNIGAINLGSARCTVRITLVASSGQPIGSPQGITLDPSIWKQLDDVFIASGAGYQDLAYATIKVQTEGGRTWAYASVIDNSSGDPTTIPVIVE